MIVTTKDGRRLSRRVDQLVGRGGDNPMTAASCGTSSTIAPGAASRARTSRRSSTRLECLDEVADIREVTRLLEQPDEKQGIRFAEAERAGVPLEATWVP